MKQGGQKVFLKQSNREFYAVVLKCIFGFVHSSIASNFFTCLESTVFHSSFHSFLVACTRCADCDLCFCWAAGGRYFCWLSISCTFVPPGECDCVHVFVEHHS